MSAAMIAQTDPTLITRQTVARALRDARSACANDPRWLNAVNRAALNLEACRWQWDGETLSIESATEGSRRYIVTADGCGCAAHARGHACWHRAARRLLVNAAAYAPRAVVNPLDESKFARLTNALNDELFAA